MSLDEFHAKYANQTVSYDGLPKNAGQCVQLAELYIKEVLGVEVPLYPAAADYFEKGVPGLTAHTGHPLRGDIVVWDRGLPGSTGFGHIDICLADGSDTGFLGFDTNWAGKTAHDVQHTYTHVLGYLRKEQDMPITPEQIDKVFKLGGITDFQEDLQNQDYANNPGLLIDTVFNAAGERKPAPAPEPAPAPPPDSVTVTKDGLWASFKKFLGLKG